MLWEIGVDEREREEEIERESKKMKKGVKSCFVFSCVLPRSSSKNKVFFVFLFQDKSLNVMSSNPFYICYDVIYIDFLILFQEKGWIVLKTSYVCNTVLGTDFCAEMYCMVIGPIEL